MERGESKFSNIISINSTHKNCTRASIMWKVVDTFKQLHLAFAKNNLHSFCLKPKQVQCRLVL